MEKSSLVYKIEQFRNYARDTSVSEHKKLWTTDAVRKHLLTTYIYILNIIGHMGSKTYTRRHNPFIQKTTYLIRGVQTIKDF